MHDACDGVWRKGCGVREPVICMMHAMVCGGGGGIYVVLVWVGGWVSGGGAVIHTVRVCDIIP